MQQQQQLGVEYSRHNKRSRAYLHAIIAHIIYRNGAERSVWMQASVCYSQ